MAKNFSVNCFIITFYSFWILSVMAKRDQSDRIKIGECILGCMKYAKKSSEFSIFILKYLYLMKLENKLAQNKIRKCTYLSYDV